MKKFKNAFEYANYPLCQKCVKYHPVDEKCPTDKEYLELWSEIDK
jgi:hypothetical protein